MQRYFFHSSPIYSNLNNIVLNASALYALYRRILIHACGISFQIDFWVIYEFQFTHPSKSMGMETYIYREWRKKTTNQTESWIEYKNEKKKTRARHMCVRKVLSHADLNGYFSKFIRRTSGDFLLFFLFFFCSCFAPFSAFRSENSRANCEILRFIHICEFQFDNSHLMHGNHVWEYDLLNFHLTHLKLIIFPTDRWYSCFFSRYSLFIWLRLHGYWKFIDIEMY